VACTRSGAGGKPGDAVAPNAAAATLTDRDIAQYAALLQMADARRPDTSLVRAALTSRSSLVRREAARVAGQVHDTTMARLLRGLLTDADTGVAANAAYSLGLIADTGSVDLLARTMPSPAVGVEAAWALGRIGEPARGAVEQLLHDSAVSASVRGALLLAAARLTPPPVDAIVPHLASSDPQVRWCAAYAIARPYAAAGVRALLPLAGDSSSLVRLQVSRALGHRGAGDSLAAPAREALRRLVSDSDLNVRINAVRSLASFGPGERGRVLSLLADNVGNVRVAAAQSLAPVLGQDRKGWLQAWNADTAYMYRRSVLISAMENDVVLPIIDEDNTEGWQHQGDWRLRASVADAGAAALNIQRMREVSLPFWRDPDPRVRVAAFAAMAPHADTAEQHPWRRVFMMPALTDQDFAVRATGLAALEGHASATEVPKYVASYRIAVNDSVNDGRLAAVRDLVAAWRRDSANFTDSLRQALADLPLPADAATRRAGDALPMLAAWRQVTDSISHPLSWYEDKVRMLVLPALAGRRPRVQIVTERGTIMLELFAEDAPLTVDNFLSLIRSGYYNDVRFHRVVPAFVAQDGDRRGDGNGSLRYTIRDELNRHRYDRGAVGMALSGPDTGGSQYFLTLTPQPHLDGGYTVFGRVIDGWAAMDALVQGDHIDAIRVQ